MDFFIREYGKGQTLIFLHGWLGMSDTWINIAKYLSEEGYHVIAPDLPNHGKSFHSDECGFEFMAGFLNDFCKHKGLESPIILGHSMGGKVALEMVNQAPSYYKGLVLIDSLPLQYDVKHFNQDFLNLLRELRPENYGSLKLFKDEFVKKNIEKQWIALVLKNLQYASVRENNKERCLEWRSNIRVLVNDLPKLLDGVKIKENVISTLVLKGEKSDFISEKSFLDFKKTFKNSILAEVENAGHWVHVDNPAKFLQQICLFLDQFK